ncbi:MULTISPECIES: 50S ribosomal protein L23 [Glycomyces]|uniref:Large ribosomal subunit protein uL23 n=1 Tax=Glycomyces buryatensis TaxID=2570927 RepID=A0A4S8Q4T6_9ACTN|nr:MULTISPECIES: 50S ribosomal protein L23 [Glycomyces]THV35649.1 50S ribosomal protein L23 [Glycomyces buryatensis]
MSEVTVADPRDIIIKPVISEKTYTLLGEGKYTFEVDPRANKSHIKIAVKQIFGVDVKSVNTLNRDGKRKRTRDGWGQRKSVKHAIVTVEGDPGRLGEIFGGQIS